MSSVKRIVLLVTLFGGFAVAAAPQADAGIFFRRVAPVRRVARAVLPPYPVARAVLPPYPVARAVLPPYPVARRVAYGPVYRPYVRPYGYWARPVVYGPGVVVGVGF